MGSRDYSRPVAQKSATEVIYVVMAELRELRASYREVTKRIRILRSVVQALRELGISPAAEATSSTDPASQSELNESCPNRNVVCGLLRRATVGQRRTVCIENPELRRACRIALIETTTAISLEEVYERIVRRGSFNFPTRDFAIRSIAQQLEDMAEHGEIRAVNHSLRRLWRRLSSHDRGSSDSHESFPST